MTTFTDEQEHLRDAVATLLAKRSDSTAVRAATDSKLGYDADLWRTLCDQIGVAALAIPEEFGGAGAGLGESFVVLEELGRALTPSPMLGSAVLAVQLLLALDDADATARLLPGIAAGSTIASVCWADADGRWGPLRFSVDDDSITGTAAFVLDGDSADALLVLTTDGVFEVDPVQAGVTRTRSESLDPTRRLGRIDFAQATATRLSGDATAAAAGLRDVACIALAAEQVGGAARVLELTVEYSKVREQFGRAIGSFQALKHRMADLHVLVEAARSAAYAALQGSLDASVAKAYCSEAYFSVAAEAIQLHGGIAITWEHDAHLYFKRAHGSAALFGSPADHIAALAAAAGIED